MLQGTGNVEEAQRVAAVTDVVLCVVGYDEMDEEATRPPPTLDCVEAEVRATIEGQKSTGFGSGSTDSDGLVPGAGSDRRSLRL
ncbi:uncharacterized protein N7482_002452 [Penicillium canariense]|uniref:Uncharacterized protein n=1 Tax=Penicillium canariense TaxID=189055 RepID=A0A9W9IIS3_9EURO|nr:uncharacterized protein N7482_002452 [Penicillium canariense]KAJ5176575.1 hypothetical protein N7482_002452 [Penicillium canariense]